MPENVLIGDTPVGFTAVQVLTFATHGSSKSHFISLRLGLYAANSTDSPQLTYYDQPVETQIDFVIRPFPNVAQP